MGMGELTVGRVVKGACLCDGDSEASSCHGGQVGKHAKPLGEVCRTTLVD